MRDPRARLYCRLRHSSHLRSWRHLADRLSRWRRRYHVRIGSPLYTPVLFPIYVALLVLGGYFTCVKRGFASSFRREANSRAAVAGVDAYGGRFSDRREDSGVGIGGDDLLMTSPAAHSGHTRATLRPSIIRVRRPASRSMEVKTSLPGSSNGPRRRSTQPPLDPSTSPPIFPAA